MNEEVPQIGKCCFCIPVRKGLIGWGCVKLAFNLLTFAYVILVWSLISHFHLSVMRIKDIAIIAVIVFAVLMDTCINIVLIVAGRQKSVKLLRVLHIHNIVFLGLMILPFCIKILGNLYEICDMSEYMGFGYDYITDLTINSAVAFNFLFVQVYLILLIRSEMINLQNQALKIQFSNHAAAGEPQCSLHNGSDGQNTDSKVVVQDCCTKETRAVQTCCTDKNSAVQSCCTEEKQAVQTCCTDKNSAVQTCCTDEKRAVQTCCTDKNIAEQTCCTDKNSAVQTCCTAENSAVQTRSTDEKQAVQTCYTDKNSTVQTCCTDENSAVQTYCTDKNSSVQTCCTDENSAVKICCTDKKPAVQSCCTDKKIQECTD